MGRSASGAAVGVAEAEITLGGRPFLGVGAFGFSLPNSQRNANCRAKIKYFSVKQTIIFSRASRRQKYSKPCSRSYREARPTKEMGHTERGDQRRKTRLRCGSLLIGASPAPSLLAADFLGQVVSVLDGDTLEVLHNNYPEHIRLSGIDCAEKGQAFGKRACAQGPFCLARIN